MHSLSMILFLQLCFYTSVIFSQEHTLYRFDFGTSECAQGYLGVNPETKYTKELGYGFIGNPQINAVSTNSKNKIDSDYCTSDQPFYFTIDIPEGNYLLSLTLGDKEGTSHTSIKVECRRLMLENVKTARGKIVKKSISVNVKTPRINEQETVLLKPRELNYLHWDNQLTIEFNGDAPKICALEIRKSEDVPTVFLAGNSTVVDQAHEPWASWGQMIPRFFEGDKLVFANFAESGETIRSFEKEKRLDKVMSLMKAGDYLFIEFAHNDQKPNSGLFAQTTYKEYLRKYILKTREKGATPVLVTSMHRRRFDDNAIIINTLEDFPDAVRDVAKELNVSLIDLNMMSKILYETLGVEKSKKAFVHYPANSFPNQPNALADDTHFSNYGAYQLAQCVLEGIIAAELPIAKHIVKDYKRYNPSKPDGLDAWQFPVSPFVDFFKPDGN